MPTNDFELTVPDLYKRRVHQNDQIPKDLGLYALEAYIAGDTLRHQPMGAGHMTVLQLCGPMGLHVLQWCHPMLAYAKRTSYCSQIITLYNAQKVDSGPRTVLPFDPMTRAADAIPRPETAEQ